MLKLVIAIFAALTVGVLSQSTYTSLVWKQCDAPGQTPAGIILDAKLLPMPIVHPGNHSLLIKAYGKGLTGVTKGELNIIRTVTGLALPVRCYLTQGVYVGSCNYTDLCKDVLIGIANMTVDDCKDYPQLAAAGFDCTCPFKIIDKPDKNDPLVIDISRFEIPDLSQSVANFLASGDFDVTIKATHKGNTEHYGCINLKFSIKPPTSG